MSSADIEIIDLLSLWPWDQATLTESVARTGRLVTLEEAPAGTGWGGNVVASIVSDSFESLVAPPHRITLPGTPVPYNGALEARYLPSPGRIAAEIDIVVSKNLSPSPWWKEAV